MCNGGNLSTLEIQGDQKLCFINTFIVYTIYMSYLIFTKLLLGRTCLKILQVVTFENDSFRIFAYDFSSLASF